MEMTEEKHDLLNKATAMIVRQRLIIKDAVEVTDKLQELFEEILNKED